MILIIYWKVSAQFWKVQVLIWWNKYDDEYVECHYCPSIRISYGMLLRVFVVVIINYCSVHKLLTDSTSRHIVYVDDTSLFQNITKISMGMSGILCVMYVIMSWMWSHLIILKSLTSRHQMVSFVCLMKNIRLTQWIKACKQNNHAWFSEMVQSYKKREFRRKIHRIQRFERQSLLGEARNARNAFSIASA
eukprot:359291_1